LNNPKTSPTAALQSLQATDSTKNSLVCAPHKKMLDFVTINSIITRMVQRNIAANKRCQSFLLFR
jgi:hypothetical protein